MNDKLISRNNSSGRAARQNVNHFAGAMRNREGVSHKPEANDKLAFEPPEPGYISEKEVFEIPLTDPRLQKPWELRLYATELVRKRLGDEAQVTSLKVKKPGVLSKARARLSGQEPLAHLCVTIKF
jgi:hypothetical protein